MRRGYRRAGPARRGGPEDPEPATVLENHAQVTCVMTDDHSELVRTFLEKRLVRWVPTA